MQKRTRKQPQSVNDRLRIIEAHIAGFGNWLLGNRYRETTRVEIVRLLACWAEWIQASGFTLDTLAEGLVASAAVFKGGKKARAPLGAGRLFIRYLRDQGILPEPRQPPSPTEIWPLLAAVAGCPRAVPRRRPDTSTASPSSPGRGRNHPSRPCAARMSASPTSPTGCNAHRCGTIGARGSVQHVFSPPARNERSGDIAPPWPRRRAKNALCYVVHHIKLSWARPGKRPPGIPSAIISRSSWTTRASRLRSTPP